MNAFYNKLLSFFFPECSKELWKNCIKIKMTCEVIVVLKWWRSGRIEHRMRQHLKRLHFVHSTSNDHVKLASNKALMDIDKAENSDEFICTDSDHTSEFDKKNQWNMDIDSQKRERILSFYLLCVLSTTQNGGKMAIFMNKQIGDKNGSKNIRVCTKYLLQTFHKIFEIESSLTLTLTPIDLSQKKIISSAQQY